jgi:hypothetical protein
MSFSATVDAMRAGTKTVTRRDPSTWTNLKPGDRLLAVEKAMGLPKGARQVPIGVIEVINVRVEPLYLVGWEQDDDGRSVGAAREGFGSDDAFGEAWIDLHGRYDPEGQVRRIEFRHVTGSEP